MLHTVRRLASVCVCVIASSSGLVAEHVEAATGSFAVTPGGSGSYTVPIQAASGTAGIAPQLALTYSSNTNDGLAGAGWSLSGISYLTRCGRTHEHDQVVEGLTLTDSDKLCLDGERMLLISGEYGKANSEYRLATDPYIRIRAVASATGAAPYFTVTSRDGSVSKYGDTADSVVNMSAFGSTVVLMRGLTEQKTATNQSLNFKYIQVPGGLLLSKVEYAPSMSVTLEYEPRPDKATVYIHGNPVRSNERLAKITTQSQGGSVFAKYELKYAISETGKSILSAISHCASTCAPDIAFDYSNPNAWSAVNRQISGHAVGAIGWDVADIFGDGTEVYWTAQKDGSHFATRFLRDGTVNNWSWSGQHGLGSGGWRLANLFGGNRKVYWSREGSTHYVTQLNKDGSAQSWTYNGALGIGDGGWDIVDLFGDGRPVYWTRNGSSHHATRLNPDGTFQNWTWAGHGIAPSGHRFINAFGDGRAIYWTRRDGTHYLTQLNSDGTVQNWTVQGHGSGDSNDFGDLFGEGRDLYWARHGANHFATRFNRDGTVQNYSWGGQGIGDGGSRLVDIFGDGRKVYWTRGGFYHYVSRFNPDGTSDGFRFDGHGQASYGWDFVDWFGDGRMMYWTWGSDGLHHVTRFFSDGTSKSYRWGGHALAGDGWRIVDLFGTGTKSYWTHGGSDHFITTPNFDPPDMLKSAKTSGGEEVEIEYASLAEMENLHKKFYRPRVVQYPLINQGTTAQVVRTVARKAAGVAGRQALYSYGNHLFEGGIQGRGNLGFEWIMVTDQATGLVNRTDYRQDFPFIGQISKVTRNKTAWFWPWERLGLTTYKYTFKAFAPTDADYASPVTCADDETTGLPLKSCTDSAIKPGNRYVVYTHEVLDKSWELNAKGFTSTSIALPQTRTTTTQDNWGNATQIKVETLTPEGGLTGYSKTTSTVFAEPDKTNWRIGRVIKSTVTSAVP